MDSEENTYTAINETYKIWKKHTPFLYSIMQTYELSTCSQTVEWLPTAQLENDWKVCDVMIGTNSLLQNAVQVVSVAVPTDDSLADCSAYREEKAENGVGSNGFIGTIGQQRLNVKNNISVRSEVMRARVNRVDARFIAVGTGGAGHEVIVYDLSKEDSSNQGIALEGHTEQGFGLAWSPHQVNKLLSGSYDKKIILHNTDIPTAIESSWQSGESIEDVKWSNLNQNVFASAHTDQKINIWDIRSAEDRPQLSRKAHNGEVYSLDFNSRSEFLLLSGGEDGDVNLWDLRNLDKKLHSFVAHNDSVNSVSWSPHSATQFASGSSDRRIILWDLSKLTQNSTQKPNGELLFIHCGHRSRVTDLSWSREQQGLLASCEQNNIMQVWRMTQSVLGLS